jgi:hypothetical protein
MRPGIGLLGLHQRYRGPPDKIIAIIQMQPLQTRKEVQKLTGHVAALNRFIMKLAEISLSFFSILHGSAK